MSEVILAIVALCAAVAVGPLVTACERSWGRRKAREFRLGAQLIGGCDGDR